jgi:hypothetical protein
MLIKSITLIILITFGSGFILFSLTILTIAAIIEYITFDVLCITSSLLMIGFITLFFYYKKYNILMSEKTVNSEDNI